MQAFVDKKIGVFVSVIDYLD